MNSPSFAGGVNRKPPQAADTFPQPSGSEAFLFLLGCPAMKPTNILTFTLLATLSGSAGRLLAQDSSAGNTRYGWGDLLDQRSSYGQGAYPEPFLVDDSVLETGEVRFDWLRLASGPDHSDLAQAEIEKSLGPVTFELELPFERDVTAGQVSEGLANVNFAARCPFYQAVSASGRVDTTFGAGLELGFPTTSAVSHNFESVPKLFNDTQWGAFTAQTVLGYSLLSGPSPDGGLDTFEYGMTLGYSLSSRVLPLPGVRQWIPVVEFSGNVPVTHDSAGQDALLIGTGLRANLRTFGSIQPRPGVMFVFPADHGGRQEAHWGIMTSLVFEF
jgi:hypothetical protein